MNAVEKLPLLALYAPTACGKTALCSELFGRSSLFFASRAEIISADSMAVYRGLDIGTAKPTAEERKNLVHHLIDVCDISQQFGAGEFVESADKLAFEIASRSKIPAVVGGTGFYLRNFLLGLPPTPPSNPLVREKLKERLSKEGSEALHAELARFDAESAKKIHPNDAFRICRALEVFEISGKPRSAFSVSGAIRSKYDVCTVILTRERNELYERIDFRVDEMFRRGLVDEVQELLFEGHNACEPGMQAIGYREFAQKWQNRQFSLSELDEIRDNIKRNSRKYAKKQFTYMKDIPGAEIFNADDSDLVIKKISDFCDYALNLLDVSGKRYDNL